MDNEMTCCIFNSIWKFDRSYGYRTPKICL